MSTNDKPLGSSRTRNGSETGLRHRNLPLLLLHARESVIAQFRPVLNAYGVTEQQWRIVRALLEHGSLEPRQIVDVCRISSPSLAGVLARMDDLGLVQRRRLEHDQRRLHVSLTPKGLALAAELGPRVEDAYQALEEMLGERLNSQLYRALDQTLERMGVAPFDQFMD